MKYKQIILIALSVALLGCGDKMTEENEPKGIIGKSIEDGKPIIWKFVNEQPTAEKQKQLPKLVVIEWKYDSGENNGMPLETTNEQMMTFEDVLDDNVTKIDFCEHAYSRTGNDLKEFVYYVNNTDDFMIKFNEALKEHPRFPINISFYDDPEWEEFKGLLKDFN